MSKSSKKAQPASSLPLTPLLYINDPQPDTPSITAISAVIPSTRVIPCCKQRDALFDHYRSNESKESVAIITSHHSDDKDHKLRTSLATYWKTAAIKQGRNFASVNLYLKSGTPAEKLKDWGTNHLDLNIAQLSPGATADKVYKWLCTYSPTSLASTSSLNPPTITTHKHPLITRSHRPLRPRNPAPHPSIRNGRARH